MLSYVQERKVKKKHYYVGDLVKHTKSNRIGMVMSPTTPLRHWVNTIYVCKVTWVDTYKSNIMDVDLLVGI